MTLLCRQNNQVVGSRQKSVHLNMARHMYQDKNMISYTIVTHSDFPDEYAHNFLRGQTLDTMARHVIHELQASFDGTPNFSAANLDIEEGRSPGKTDKIQKTLNAVTDKMRGNINRMFEN